MNQPEEFKRLADQNEIASNFEEITTHASIMAAMPAPDESDAVWRKIEEAEANQ